MQCQVGSFGASGHDLTTLAHDLTIEIGWLRLNVGSHVAANARLDAGTVCLVNTTDVSGQCAEPPLLTLTALFV
jgi:hypothetical protein